MTIEPIAFTPRHPDLKKHIRYYYFLKTEEDTFESKYYAYPHTDTVLNIHRHARLEIDGYYTKVIGGPANPPSICIQGIREYPLLAHLTGKLDKVTILFRPLGINHFVNTPFGNKYRSPSMVFDDWNDHPRHAETLNTLFSANDLEARRSMLEDLLVSKLQPFPEHSLLDRAINSLANFNKQVSIDELCSALQISPRTLNRLFSKHLKVAPLTFRKVARFRNSLSDKLFVADLKRLTDVAYQGNYYDQSHFNKIFRRLTGANPKLFFKEIQSLADERLLFRFVKNEHV